jgi:DNA-binding helix-hairpin-helix protein with protein kinase domain
VNAPTYFGPGRRPLALGKRLGKGGEGEVYALADRPKEAVKLYTLTDLESRHLKIAAMIDAGLAKQSSLVAFPIELVTDSKGRFAGFTMNLVNAHKPIHELYAPGSRKTEFPGANYPFLVRTATNVARSVATVHRSGCTVIGDINHSGILVSPMSATVALIDADSFQVVQGAAKYLCRVGVPEYTCPELQGRPFDSVTRTQNHDAFGLAVVIFQLLWMGRHPFSGRFSGGGDMPLERAIAEGRFAYSEQRKVGMQPPPAVPTLSDFPAPIRQAFERAFTPGATRPSASEWVGLLTELEKQLRPCAKHKLHHYPKAAAQCPWCRMEAAFNVDLFLPQFSPAGAEAADQAGTLTATDLSRFWAAIEAVNGPASAPPPPPLKQVKVGPSAMASDTRRQVWGRRFMAVLLLAAAVALAVGVTPAWFVWLPAGGIALRLLFTLPREAGAVVQAARNVDTTYRAAFHQWCAQAASTPFDAAKLELQEARDELQRLPIVEKQQLDSYAQNRRSLQLKLYLQRHQIRRYKIKGVGPSKLATLTSYGIDTAEDVSSYRIQSVPGFGPVIAAALVDWRRRIESRFVYDPNSTQQDQVAIAQIRAGIVSRRNTLKDKLARGPAQLTSIAAKIQTRRATIDPEFQALHERWLQASADMALFGQALTPLPAPPPSPAPATRAPTTAQPAPAASTPPRRHVTPPARSAVPTCPRCGSRMIQRMARRGANSGHGFWGCSRYPTCRGTRS